MNEQLPTPSERPGSALGHHPSWLVVLLALVFCQAWQAPELFGPERDWNRVFADEPVLSGRHPLHLYHGWLGAQSLREHWQPSCYDPAFCAGYPKTPVFDSGSRPAEVALALAGRFSPAAYNLLLVGVCVIVPLAVYGAARAAGLMRGVASLSAALAVLVWRARPGREALEAGDLDLSIGALALCLQTGLLLRYHRNAGPMCLLGISVTGAVAWFVHPLVMLFQLPAFLVYYASAGAKRRLLWHAPLLCGVSLALASNVLWLRDLVAFWWVRVPPSLDAPLMDQPCPRTCWEAPLWGAGVDKVLVAVLMGTSLLGLVFLNKCGKRVAARYLGLCGPGFALLALAGVIWEPLGRLGADRLLLVALWFAVLPAAYAMVQILDAMRTWSKTIATPITACIVVPLIVWLVAPGWCLGDLKDWGGKLARPAPLAVGLGPDRQALVDTIRLRTDSSARILWEDRSCDRKSPVWTALLPLLTDRAYMGGLGADAGIEHAAVGLVDGELAGRSLAEWSDEELAEYCRRYNIGWVVSWSERARTRFGRWSVAGSALSLPGQPEGTLFTLSRSRSYVLSGAATWCSADVGGILLADVQPGECVNKGGHVVLSLHYQAGMRVRPSRVTIEPAIDSRDTIPFVRLRIDEPVGRVFITWEGR